MVATTSPIGLPFPEVTDRVADGWDAVRDLAVAVNDAIVADRAALAARATTADAAALDTRLDALEAAVGDTGWVALSLGSGWSNYGGGFLAAAARKRYGVVHLRGLVKRNGSGGTTIATLAAGFRPGGLDMYTATGVSYFNPLSIPDEYVTVPDVGLRVEINASGVITPTSRVYSGLAEVPYLSLAGISFLAEA